MSFTKKDKELYDKQLKIFQREDPEISIILDATVENADWLHGNRKKKKKDTSEVEYNIIKED